MPWTTPKTWAAGEVVTAANMNLYLRDNTEIMGASRPSARIYQTAVNTLLNNTPTSLQFDTESFDVGGLHSTTTNTERMTITTPGIYLLQATVSFAANATGYRRVSIVNQVGNAIATEARAAFGTFNNEISLVGVSRLAAGDYAYVQATQTSGGSLNTVTGFTGFVCVWIGPY